MSSWRQPGRLLGVVAVLHAVSPLILLGTHWWFGVDETVYLSQLNAHLPAGLFSAPRARGPTFVAAPITLVTSSVAAVRIWVAMLSGLGLYLAFRPWLRLRAGYVVPLAALIFATIWTVTYYGFEVMPNEWVAFGILAATGYLLRYLFDGARRHLLAVAVAMALIAFFRPSDALYSAIALGVTCVFVRAPTRRRLQMGAALLLGTAVGISEWLIEAVVSYGGVAARITAAQAENGGSGLHFAVLAQARALAGPLLCRGTCHVHAALIYQLWWVLLGGLVVVAVGYSWHGERRSVELVPAAVGLVLAGEYAFTVTYAAPRFLVPAYALLALPCASGALRLLRSARAGSPRVALAVAFIGLLAVHTAIQVRVITAHVGPRVGASGREVLAEAHRLNQYGVRGPCLVLGEPSINANLAYATGCTNVPRDLAAVRDKLEDGTRVVWVTSSPPPSGYGVGWQRVRLPNRLSPRVQIAYVSAAKHRAPTPAAR